MIESTSNRKSERRSFFGERYVALGLLGATQVAFAMACSPVGVRSGQWSIPGLGDPDFLVFAASGAILIHFIVLYPVWAALGPGDDLRRIPLTGILCAVLIGAGCWRGWLRGHDESLILPITVGPTYFALITLGAWLAGRRWGWRIDALGAPATPSRVRSFRPQFGLRHLLAGITLAACILAFYRFHYPHGFPAEALEKGWREFARMGQAIPFIILLIFPAAGVPWLVLTLGVRGKWATLAAAACVVGLDGAAVWLGSFLDLYYRMGQTVPGVAAMQLGASAAGLVSAIILRRCGYRVFRGSGSSASPLLMHSN